WTDSDWNTAKTVTVTGVADDQDDGNQTGTLRISVGSDTNDVNYSALPNDNVSVNVTDIDTVGFTITESAGSSTVSETGTTDTFTIELDTIPTGNVVIDLSSADTAEVTVSPASLTFTTGDWNTPQTVTLTGQADNSDDGDQAIAITAAINTTSTADTQYDGVSSQNFNATVTDIDTASFTVTQPSNVSETGTTSTFTVVLDLLPTANVTIDVSSNDTGEATVSPASLTFTTGDWSTAQTVTVTGVDDDVDDDNQNTTIEVNPNNGSADAQYGALATQNVYVTTTDDDSAGFTLAETGGSTSVNESGTSDTFTVVLDTEPTGNVVFDLTSANTAEMIVSPASLTFLTGNWNAAQTVTVTGVDDADDDDDQTVSVSVAINTGSTADSFYDAVGSQDVNVTVVDDEVAPLVTLSASATTVTEDSGTITLTATQTFATASDTTVTLTGTGGTADNSSDYTVGTITISAGDTTGTTSFTPDRDKVDENDETATVEVTAVSSAAGATEDGTQSVTITINDDDTAALKYSHISGSTSVTEGGSTDSLTLYLGSEPTGNVVVDISYTQQDQVEVTTPSSLQLTFTPTNYMNTQVITLRAIDDDFIDGDHTSTVTISVNAGLTADSNYDGLSSKNKTVSIIDDDTSGIADFTIDSIDRDYGRLTLNWTAPTGIVNDGDTTSAGGSDDYYRVYWTTVAPGARTPANRDIDQTDNATRTIDGDRIIFVHGGLNSATYYYYRLAVYDTSTGAWKFSTNELGASPLPVECTSTGGTSEITDNDPDLLVYYPLNNDLQDHSPQGTRTGTEGWPYHLAEASSDSDIDFGEGCAYGNSAYMSGSGAYDGTRGNGTWGVNNNFSNADFPANDGNWTVSVWTSPDGDLEKFTSIFSTGDNNKGPELQLDVDDQYEPIGRIRLFNKMSDNLKGQQLRQSTWYHVVAVHHADDSVELYVNNVLKDTATNWSYVDGSNLQWDKIKIGQNRWRDANYKGYIDEFKIYGRAFTASEVANLYNFTLPPAVESINVSGQGGSTLRLTWDEVDGAIDYTIFQAEKSSGGLTNVITFTNPNLDTSADPDLSAISGITSCTSGSCSYDVTGLTNNMYYYYRIAARNGRGSGQVSPNSEVSTQCCSP
ncbi:MAG: LamG-like jellyroll fold domain-containing protein, partial [Deltaproteobacteria bacterium]